MATMGSYCKAYTVDRIREYPEWAEKSRNVKKEKQQLDGKEIEVTRELAEGDILYLQENYAITDGIFLDESIIFNDITPEWISFCQEKLDFHLPVSEPVTNHGGGLND